MLLLAVIFLISIRKISYFQLRVSHFFRLMCFSSENTIVELYVVLLQIEVGDVICEIETDKATLEFESLEEGYCP